MQITVKFYGNLKKYLPGKREITQIEIDPDTTIRTLLSELGVPDAAVWMSAINDNVVDESSVLHEGDLLEVFEPVGGGCKSPRGAVGCGCRSICALAICVVEAGCLYLSESRNFIDS